MITLFPIRHHGPGSAFALSQALQTLQPDIILIEGPADATAILHWLNHEEMEPPIALLSYRPDVPGKSTVGPMAVFSPEYQAIRYGFGADVPVRFCDIPYGHLLSLGHSIPPPPAVPFNQLSQIVNMPSYERWWNLFVEQRQDTADLFPAVNELIAEMRRDLPEPDDSDEKEGAAHLLSERREAYMRQSIRQAEAEGFHRIAVIVGAWHSAALTAEQLEAKTAEDGKNLYELPIVPVEHSWIPWTYSRMSAMLGYSAGVRSPGWYHHLWEQKQVEATASQVSTQWLKKVADLLRQEGFESSSAHIIEAVRLSQAVAAVRDLPFPGLPELNDAVQTVMCQGYAEPIQLIQRRLIIGERMGDIPADTPQTPLQKDVRQTQRQLNLRPSPDPDSIQLDLRQAEDKQRSIFLHRLNLLDIPWGQVGRSRGIRQGTYTEVWKLQWEPGYTIKLVTASMWGNTLGAAVGNYVLDLAHKASSLRELSQLLDKLIIADLPEPLVQLLHMVENKAAVTSDVLHLMQSIPPLAHIMRYGDVRDTDQVLVQHIVESLFTRVCIGLPTTCISVDDKAAQELNEAINALHPIIALFNANDLIELWQETVEKLATAGDKIHGLIAGSACRQLFKNGRFDQETTAAQMSLALSRTGLAWSDMDRLLWMVAWLDGFLQGSEMVLVHDLELWQLLADWVAQLPEEQFMGIMPLLRRTFSSFSEGVREQLGRRIRGQHPPEATSDGTTYDTALANQLLPYLEKILGVATQE